MTTIEQQLLAELSSGFGKPFNGEIYDYAKKLNLQNGYAVRGRFDVHRSKYLIRPFQSLRNRAKRVINIKKAVQTFGSGVADLTVPYWIENDPGGILWLLQDDDFAKKYADGRFMQLLKSIPEIRDILSSVERNDVTKTTIHLATMSMMMGGLNEGNVQSLSWQRVIIDEAWMSGSSGLLRQAKDRTTAFPHTSKILIIGQGGEVGDDSNIEWEDSNKQEYAWCCPKCKKLQIMEWTVQRSDGSWAGIIWETNEFTKPGGKFVDKSYEGGRWNYPEVGKTARFVCVYCGHSVSDTPSNRRLLNDTSDYIVTAPNAPAEIDGFHWPAMACSDISLSTLVQKYLKAKLQDEEHGNRLPLQEFHQKQLGKDWDPNVGTEVHRFQVEPYEINLKWPDERYRVLTIDCQADFKEFWYVARAKALHGESRQLARGKVHTWEELAEVQAQWGVKDQHVFVDAGYEQTKVLQECVKHGHWGFIKGKRMWLCWNALKGMDKETWPHVNAKGEKDHRVYSPKFMANPGLGRARKAGEPLLLVPMFYWSNLHIKDTLRRHRDGKAAKFLCLPCDDTLARDHESFTSQMNSEKVVWEKNERTGKKTRIWKPIGSRPNHWWDCECEHIAVDYILGIIGDVAIEESTDESEQKEAA